METSLGYISFITSSLLFIILGYRLSYKFHLPVSPGKWSVLIFATILSGTINFRIIDIFGFIVRSNWCLPALGLGIVMGLVIRMIKSEIKIESVSGN
ncbi:MAG TPA: hypothetical protein VKA34_12955 [Balneolales bacterium]|nr:hypothetical protein [Balneolales bacterium]